MRNIRRLGATCFQEAEQALSTVKTMNAYKLLTEYYERKVLAAVSALIYSFGGDASERPQAEKLADETVGLYEKAITFIWEEIDKKKGSIRGRALDGKSYRLPDLIERERRERKELARVFKWPAK